MAMPGYQKGLVGLGVVLFAVALVATTFVACEHIEKMVGIIPASTQTPTVAVTTRTDIPTNRCARPLFVPNLVSDSVARREQELEDSDRSVQRPRPTDGNRLTFVNDTKDKWVELREGSTLYFHMKPYESFDLYCGFKVPITLVIYELKGTGERKILGTVNRTYLFDNKRDRYGRPPPSVCRQIVIKNPGDTSLEPVVLEEGEVK